MLPNIGLLNIPIADPALGAINFVYAFYTESGAGPMPHETNGTTPDTQALAGFQVVVMTDAQFAALPLTDPTYLQLAQDRGMLVGIVTGTGGALLPSSIEQPVEWRTLKYSSVAAPGVAGVTVQAVSDDTPTGANGTIFYDATGPLTLAWQAPGEAGPGPAVTITSEGTYVLTALGGSTITVYVVPAALPIVSTNAAVVITGIYDQVVPRESGTDRHHRSKVGSGIVTPQNPHGLSLDDISPGFIDEVRNHQRFAHSTGIYRGSAAGVLQGTIVEVSAPDSFLVNPPGGSDSYYVDGKRLVAILNSSVVWTDAVPGAAKELYEVYVDPVGNVLKSKRAAWLNAAAAITGVENLIVYINEEVAAGNHTLTYTSNGVNAGGTLQWNGGNPTPVPGPIAGLTNPLFRVRNGDEEIAFFFGQPALIDALPAGVYSDTIVVAASADNLTGLVTAQLPWTGSATGGLGYTLSRGIIAARYFDIRRFGTLADFHMADPTLRLFEQRVADHSPDGVVVGSIDAFVGRSLAVTTPGGLSVDIVGSSYVYVRGRRFVVDGSTGLAIPNNDFTLLYVDENGVIQSVSLLSVLPSFLFDPKQSGWNGTDGDIRYGAALAIITTSAGVITDILDMRRNLSGGNTGIIPYSVGGTLPGTVAEGTEFFDVNAALLYASAAASPGQEAMPITVVDAVLKRVINPANGVYTFRGGTIWLDGPVLASSAFIASGSTFNLDGVVFRAMPTLTAPGLTSALVTLGANGKLSWRGGGLVAGASMSGLVSMVRVTSASSKLTLSDLTVDTGAIAPFPSLAYATANAGINVAAVRIEAGGLRALVVANGVSLTDVGVSDVSDAAAGGTAIYELIGVGAIIDGIFSLLRNIGAPIGAVNQCRIAVSNSSLGSTGWSLLDRSVFIDVTFSAGNTFTSCSRLRLTDCSADAVTFLTCTDTLLAGIVMDLGFIRFDGGSRYRLVGARATQLQLAGALTDVSVYGATFTAVNGIAVTAGASLSRVTIEECSFDRLSLANVTHKSVRLVRNAISDQVVANVGSNPSADLLIEANQFTRAAAGIAILLNDLSGVRIERNVFVVPSCRNGIVQWGPFAGDIEVVGNRFEVSDGEDESYGTGLVGWGVPVLYAIDVAAATISTRTDGVRVAGNTFVVVNTSPNPVPMIAVLCQVDKIVPPDQNYFRNFRVEHNTVRYADYSAPNTPTPYTWTSLNGVAMPNTQRIMLFAVADSDPSTWGVSPAGHSRNVQYGTCAFNRIIARGTAPQWILALAYDVVNPFTDLSFKVIFNGGALGLIDAPGALILSNE